MAKRRLTVEIDAHDDGVHCGACKWLDGHEPKSRWLCNLHEDYILSLGERPVRSQECLDAEVRDE